MDEPDAAIARLERVTVWTVVLASAGGAALGPSYLAGTLMGGAVAIVNFGALGYLVRRLTGERPDSVSWLGVFGVLLRYILLCIALFVIISVWQADVVALAVGLSAPVVAIFIECGRYIYREFGSERENQR